MISLVIMPLIELAVTPSAPDGRKFEFWTVPRHDLEPPECRPLDKNGATSAPRGVEAGLNVPGLGVHVVHQDVGLGSIPVVGQGSENDNFCCSKRTPKQITIGHL